MAEQPAVSHDATLVIVDPDPRAASTARRWATTFCRDVGVPPATDDEVGLVLSELVENARTHADGPIRVHLHCGSDSLRAEVSDSSSLLPDTRPRPEGAPGGRGIAIVAAVARSWGFNVEQGGKTVWAEVPVASGPTSEGSSARSGPATAG